MTRNYQRQIKLYRKETEAWKTDHDAVMKKYANADKLSAGIFTMMEAFDEFSSWHWQDPITVEKSRVAASFQLAWYECAMTLAQAGDKLQLDSFDVAGLASLHRQIQSVSANVRFLKKHLAALVDFEAGNEFPVQG